jgi:hypothetical protein
MKKFAVCGTFILAALSVLAARASAQDAPAFEYAVKFVCGKSAGRVVAPGIYFTAINVHNPTGAVVVFKRKVATALPGEGGQVTPFAEARLKPDQALEIDCPEILRQAGNQDFLKGFTVIVSTVELDVVAVYTAAGATGRVETMHVERFPARRQSGCVGPDLIVETIEQPTWDSANRQSEIRVTIKNIGNDAAGPSYARVVDPSTPQPGSGAPYNDVASVPALAPGASVTVIFHLPYWVFNPDATLEVTADYKNNVKECREDNNVKTFQGIG